MVKNRNDGETLESPICVNLRDVVDFDDLFASQTPCTPSLPSHWQRVASDFFRGFLPFVDQSRVGDTTGTGAASLERWIELWKPSPPRS